MAQSFFRDDWQPTQRGFDTSYFEPPKPAPQPKKKKGGRGGFLSSLISEGGGLGGAVGGAALGTAILPGIGTLVGAGLGGFLGGTSGRLAENKVRDDEFRLGDALKEGAVSGVMGAGPLRLGKAAIGTVKAARGGTTLSQALADAGSKATQGSVRGKVGQKLTQASDDLVIKDFRLTPSQLTNFKKKYGEDPSQVIKKYKLTGKDSETIRQSVIQPLQQEFDTIGSKLPTVSTDTIKKAFEKKYSPLLNSAAEDNKAVGRQLKNQSDTIIKKYGPEVKGNEVANLRREFDSLVSYADKTANPARYNVNKRAADTLRSVLQDTADKVGLKASDGKTFKEVGLELNKLRQLTDNIAKQENLGRGNLPLGLTNLLGGGVGASMGPAGALGGILTAQAINSTAGRKTIAKAAEKTGAKLTRASDPYSLKSTAGRILPVAGLGAALEADQTLSLPNNNANMSATPTSTAPAMNSNISEQLYQTSDDLSSALASAGQQNPYPQENLLYDIQRDPSNADEYIAYYQSLQEIFNPQSTQTVPKKLTEAQAARSEAQMLTDQALELLNGGSVNVGMVQGPLESLKARFNAADPETYQFQTITSSLKAAIAKARAGTSFTEGEKKMLEKYTPNNNDSAQQLITKLQLLKSIYDQAAVRDQGVEYTPTPVYAQ